MKSNGLMKAAVIVPLALAAAPGTARAQAIDWHLEAALAVGSGCRSAPPADAFLIAFGNQVSVVAANLGVRLPAFPGDERTMDLRNCQAVIPMTLQQGWYIGKVTQRLSYGVLKSPQSTGTLISATSLLGAPVASLTAGVPGGWRYIPSTTVTKTTDTGIIGGCAGTVQGLFKNNVAISAQRADASEIIAIGASEGEVPGLDMRFDTIISTFHCP